MIASARSEDQILPTRIIMPFVRRGFSAVCRKTT
jgi:hypothetical protein